MTGHWYCTGILESVFSHQETLWRISSCHLIVRSCTVFQAETSTYARHSRHIAIYPALAISYTEKPHTSLLPNTPCKSLFEAFWNSYTILRSLDLQKAHYGYWISNSVRGTNVADTGLSYTRQIGGQSDQ